MKRKCKLPENVCQFSCNIQNINNCETCCIPDIKEYKKTNIICPIHKQEVLVPCQITDCIYYTKTSFSKVNNCILVYMAQEKMITLNAEDISILTNISLKQVNYDLKQAMALLRTNVVYDNLNTEIDAKFDILTNKDVCVVCEKPVLSENKYNLYDKYTIKYCSNKCISLKPPAVILLEYKCQEDIKTILKWTIKKYNTLGALEQALGMNRWLLGKQLRIHLGINADTLYKTTQRVRTRKSELLRRTGQRPKWLDTFITKIKQQLNNSTKLYGQYDLDIEKMNLEINNIINTL